MIRVRPPGDKSVSHRALLFAALASEPSELRGLGDGADVRTTAAVLASLGAVLSIEPAADGYGLEAMVTPSPLRSPDAPLDCGNSGTTARLLAGVVAGLGIEAVLDGDESLRARPMRRVIYPLQAMGARAEYEGEPDRLPVRLRGRATGSLRTLRHRPRVASAQVKSAILLAGLTGRVPVAVVEPGRSRDHTERMLAAMGAPIRVRAGEVGGEVLLDPAEWDGRLEGLDMDVPGDPSSAAFLIAAALLRAVPIAVDRVSLNPTRTGFLRVLEEMGAEVRVDRSGDSVGEPSGSWVVRPPSRLRPFRVAGALVPEVIDELPVLAILAARADGESDIRDAAELRVKESDRIERLAANLRTLGARVEERPDGLSIHGGRNALAGRVGTGGDHRIAMAFGALGAGPDASVELDDPACASISFPAFWSELDRIRACAAR